VYGEVGKWLGAATAKYINRYEPDVLILGGGMLCANELLIANVRSSLVAQSSAKTGKVIEIFPSHLGSDAALIGAGVPFFNKSLTEQIKSA
jgi:glucokinase